jgi:mannose-1-phosphate guanylyltransferase / mannose-6-phosphate isomerase
MDKIIPVIMCGGAGTRLWPVSRESMPKQFVPLVGQASTFQQVLARITDLELFARPIVNQRQFSLRGGGAIART